MYDNWTWLELELNAVIIKFFHTGSGMAWCIKAPCHTVPRWHIAAVQCNARGKFQRESNDGGTVPCYAAPHHALLCHAGSGVKEPLDNTHITHIFRTTYKVLSFVHSWWNNRVVVRCYYLTSM